MDLEDFPYFKIEELLPNRVFSVVREDGQVAGVTDSKPNILSIMKDEYGGTKIKLVSLIYNKQEMDYTFIVEIEDEDGIKTPYEFTVALTAIYRTTTKKDTMINWAEGLITPFTFTDEDKQDLIDQLNDL